MCGALIKTQKVLGRLVIRVRDSMSLWPSCFPKAAITKRSSSFPIRHSFKAAIIRSGLSNQFSCFSQPALYRIHSSEPARVHSPLCSIADFETCNILARSNLSWSTCHVTSQSLEMFSLANFAATHNLCSRFIFTQLRDDAESIHFNHICIVRPPLVGESIKQKHYFKKDPRPTSASHESEDLDQRTPAHQVYSLCV